MTTTAGYKQAKKVNGWVIDREGRTKELPWRCWKIDDYYALNNRQKSFRTKREAVLYARHHY